MTNFEQANRLLKNFKGDRYLHGMGVMNQVGSTACTYGRQALLMRDVFPQADQWVGQIRQSLENAGVTVIGEVAGAAPNAPREDLQRIYAAVADSQPDLLVSFGGGSTIDAVKAAGILAVLGGTIEDYFGTGLVTQALQMQGKQLLPHMAIQTAASSGAHLTKYSNITDLTSGQKKLIVDDAIVPQAPVFDYSVTLSAPLSLTADGALDGISHALEVLYSAAGKHSYGEVLPMALEVIRLVVNYLPVVLKTPADAAAREALGLATDLGGYTIMIGGTNGAHLTSFSLVDILPHGRACGMLNPYYTVFFAPSVEDALLQVGAIYQQAGYISADLSQLRGRDLGLAVAGGMLAFEKSVGFPTTLSEVPGFTQEHIQRALTAAKNPQLRMKLENMPVPLTPEMVDQYMGAILQAAATGNMELIQTTA